MTASEQRTVHLFDFCGTLVHCQTVDRFIHYVLTHYFSFSPIKIFLMFQTTRFLPRPQRKALRFQLLKGIKEKDFLELAHQFAKTLFFEEVRTVTERIETLDDHDNIFIVSAGLREYIIPFAKNHGIDNVIANTMEIKTGKLTGRLSGNDCYGQEKVNRLSNCLDLQHINHDHSSCYSDSMSDRPLFDLVKNRYFIKNGKIIDISQWD